VKAHLFYDRVGLFGLVRLAIDWTLLVIKAELDFELLAEHGTSGNSTSS
jgi:hypothetical protein